MEETKLMSIKDIRLAIDTCINSIKLLNGSREITLCHTQLQRSFSWAGESLKAAGSESPYKLSETPSVKEIEPQADKTETTFAERWASLDQTQTALVKDFRAILSHIIKEYRELWMREVYEPITTVSKFHEYCACIEESIAALVEAKIWLGWELGRIRDIDKGPLSTGGRQPLPL